ncbi:zinc finger protein 761 [Rhipicephalus sanguineus]|uniref:zinc finger protein 761 n=1 Tax=Rhipicephalus sanguineus TaxID=34632 RepID=UPI0018956DB3|nr:zinc finger protein 761 [Rhipicephalus sanguineus]
MTGVDIKIEPSSPISALPHAMTDVAMEVESIVLPNALPDGTAAVDIKVEPINPPATLSYDVMGIDIKVEPSSPPTTPLPDEMGFDIKVEPTSPPTTTPPDVMGIDIKVEPSSPPTTPPPDEMGIDIKVEPTSPPTTPPPTYVDTNKGGPAADSTVASDSTETSKDSMDISLGILEGATESSPRKCDRSVGSLYECDVCGKCFKGTGSLKRHRTLHTARKPEYSCTLCSRQFPNNYRLFLHKFEHTGENPYPCHFCGKKSSSKAGLIKHKRLHTGEMPYVCQICPSKFCSKGALERHKQLHAAGVEMVHCPECGKTFKRAKALQTHLKRQHRKERPLSCHLCPAKFTYECHLKMHALTHSSEKRHKCAVCERGYSRRECLRRHVATMHVGVKAAMASTDSRVEMPSSPLSMQPPDPLEMDTKEPSESPVIMPKIFTAASSTSGTQIPGSVATTDSNKG